MRNHTSRNVLRTKLGSTCLTRLFMRAAVLNTGSYSELVRAFPIIPPHMRALPLERNICASPASPGLRDMCVHNTPVIRSACDQLVPCALYLVVVDHACALFLRLCVLYPAFALPPVALHPLSPSGFREIFLLVVLRIF